MNVNGNGVYLVLTRRT